MLFRSYCVLQGYTQCVGGSDAPLRQSNGMQYDLPEMLPGLKAGLTMVLGEMNTANGGAATGDGNGFSTFLMPRALSALVTPLTR